ncbi:RNA exonuclease 1-like, partial [Sigmodon hispidus]
MQHHSQSHRLPGGQATRAGRQEEQLAWFCQEFPEEVLGGAPGNLHPRLPDNEIVDYNTIFPRVTEEDLANTNVRLSDVQAMLLNVFSTETILIGHSLESDLLALKFIHSNVVDTSVLFPHHPGLPYKRYLRGLIFQYLNQKIQTHKGGHNSIEDASACVQLVTWKMQEDTKASRPPQQQATCLKCQQQQ